MGHDYNILKLKHNACLFNIICQQTKIHRRVSDVTHGASCCCLGNVQIIILYF